MLNIINKGSFSVRLRSFKRMPSLSCRALVEIAPLSELLFSSKVLLSKEF